MPDVDGLEVCRRLREGPCAGEQPRVLMLTARDTIDDRIAGLDSGADDYLVKPFAFEELSARLRALGRIGVNPVASRVRFAGLRTPLTRPGLPECISQIDARATISVLQPKSSPGPQLASARRSSSRNQSGARTHAISALTLTSVGGRVPRGAALAEVRAKSS